MEKELDLKKTVSVETKPKEDFEQKYKIPRKDNYFVSNFSIDKLLGMGSFGKVFLVCDKNNTNQRYAAKVIDYGDRGITDIDKIINEIEVIKSLNHPNIIAFYDAFFDNKSVFIISELGECDLEQEMKFKAYSQKLTDIKLFSYSETLKILHSLCSALEYAELKMFYHGDIRPENIIKVNDTYKLAGWGTCVLCKNSLNQSQIVDIIGLSLNYSAPEIVETAKKMQIFFINPSKCNIYSLGVVLFQIYFIGLKKLNKRKIIKIVKFYQEKYPQYYPNNFCDLILLMTNEDSRKRPSYSDIINFLRNERKQTSLSVSLEFNSLSFSKDDDMIEIEKLKIRYNTYAFLTYNKFFDFSFEIEVIKKLKTYEKVIVVSVSGKSGIGKSFNLNLILSLISNYSSKTAKIPYLEVFKVGNSVTRTTNGIDACIYNLDDKKAILVLDVQGNNDHKAGKENWKFLYICLLYMAFAVSDYHFIFYSENTEDLQNDQIKHFFTMLKENSEEKSDFIGKKPEIICCYKTPPALKGEKLEYKLNEHNELAKNFFKGQDMKSNTYFLKYNEEFYMDSEKSCIKETNPYFCDNCQQSEIYKEILKISKNILETVQITYESGEKICQRLNHVRMEAENKRSGLLKKFYDSGDIYLDNIRYTHAKDIDLASKFDPNIIYQNIWKKDDDNFKIFEKEIQLSSKMALNLIKIHITSKLAMDFISNEIEQNENIDQFDFIFLKKQFIENMKKYEDDMQKNINDM